MSRVALYTCTYRLTEHAAATVRLKPRTRSIAHRRVGDIPPQRNTCGVKLLNPHRQHSKTVLQMRDFGIESITHLSLSFTDEIWGISRLPIVLWKEALGIQEQIGIKSMICTVKDQCHNTSSLWSCYTDFQITIVLPKSRANQNAKPQLICSS